MNPYIEKLKAHLETYPKDGREYDSVMELLCHYYVVENPAETSVIRDRWKEAGEILERMTIQDNDRLFRIMVGLCDDYSAQAFKTGLRTGAELVLKLRDE